MGHSSDDYDAYDLSEFSAADFVHIDSSTRASEHAGHGPTDDATGGVEDARRRVGTSGSGGPQIAVALEHAADEFVLVKVAGGGSRSEADNSGVVGATQNADRGKSSRGDLCHSPNATDSRSPYEAFRTYGTLSVSDLVRPAWCEVQFDYGLRQGRSRALADRPDSFVSAGGKVIMMDKKVAEDNEEVLEHGRSVHKELENELHPEQVVVAVETKEEYWAIRLFDMLGRLDTLMELHCCREMPVFGIVQDQPVIGIIDEISLKTIPIPKSEPNFHNKRVSTSAPGTPKRSKKRREMSPSQSHVTDFFPSPSKAKANASRSPSPMPAVVHELSILDTKTRHVNSLPSDNDAFSSHMQLMLYHHLLSKLLSPTFSFSTFWEKVQVDPFAKFTDEFLQQSGVAPQIDGKVVLGFPECLGDVADLWRSTVDSLCLQSVSPTLEIVYRTKSKRSAALIPKPSRADTSSHFAVAEQEKREIDRAIEASLREIGHDPDLERAIAESMRDMTQREECSAAVVDVKNCIAGTRSPSPRGSEQLSDMPHIPWYTWSGEMESGTAPSAGSRPTREWNTAEPHSSGLQAALSRPDGPKVIGTKRFAFDEAAMHTYVRDVLQWWRGERPPRGVEVEQTRRCFTCEYRDACEWREKKATEAQEKYINHTFCKTEGAGSFDTT